MNLTTDPSATLPTEASDANLSSLAALRSPAPADLAPTVLVRVGLADEYFTADAKALRIFVAYNGRGISATLSDPNNSVASSLTNFVSPTSL